jgi:chitinase
VTVTASAASTLGVAQVAFSWREQGNAAWTACGPADTTAPYACAWDTTLLADGAYELRAELIDGSGATATSATVAVVVRRLRAYYVQGTALPNGVAGVGDTITLTYSGLVDLDTVRAGWTGPATTSPVVLHHQNDGTPLIQGRDYLSFAADVNLGQVAFAQNFINSQSATFGAATMTADTITVDGLPATRITISLGAPTSGGQRLRTTSNTGTTQWTPSAVAADSSGTSCAVTTVDESGITDADL